MMKDLSRSLKVASDEDLVIGYKRVIEYIEESNSSFAKVMAKFIKDEIDKRGLKV